MDLCLSRFTKNIMKKYLICVFLLFLIITLTSCSATNSNTTTSTLTTSIENNTETITHNHAPITNYEGKTKQTGIISISTTDIPTMSNKLIELIDKNYAGLTNELKEEFESYMVSRSPESSFKYLNNSETSGNFIILGEFNGCVVFYDNPTAFEFEEVNLAGYSFGVGGRVNIYKSQAWYMTIYDAYIRGLLTDENIRDLRELYIEFDTYLWQRESPQE